VLKNIVPQNTGSRTIPLRVEGFVRFSTRSGVITKFENVARSSPRVSDLMHHSIPLYEGIFHARVLAVALAMTPV